MGEGASSGPGLITVNHTVDYAPVTCKSGLGSVETGLVKLGAFVGDNGAIGARHVLGPGAILKHGTIIPDSTTI